jgi:hypothetical protein
MIEIGSLTALVLGEIMVGLIILSFLLLLFTLLRKGRIRKAANRLAERVQADKAKRTERLKSLLQDRYQMESPKLDQTLHGIVQTEMTLYQNMLNGFLKDDQVYLQQIDVDVENLVLSYQSLGAAVSGSTTSLDGDGSELDHLRAENAKLSEELKVTMDTMGRMLNEYSTMFADGTESFMNTANQVDQSAAAQAQGESVDATTVLAEVETNEEDMVIPDMTEQELTESALPETEDLSATMLADVTTDAVESTADTEEEVSEIIDEVMEIADEMIHDNEASESDQAGESMVDDLSKIDIEIPEVDDATTEQTESEQGSLEEEWAKLLEEESSSGEEDKDSR